MNPANIGNYYEDFKEGASEKFKIGDIVKLKKNAELDPFDSKNKNRLYVVRYLPRKFNGEKYLKTKKEWLKTTLFIFKIYYLLEAFHSSNCFCISVLISSNPAEANFLFKSSNPFTGSTEPEYKVLSNSCNTLLIADI